MNGKWWSAVVAVAAVCAWSAVAGAAGTSAPAAPKDAKTQAEAPGPPPEAQLAAALDLADVDLLAADFGPPGGGGGPNQAPMGEGYGGGGGMHHGGPGGAGGPGGGWHGGGPGGMGGMGGHLARMADKLQLTDAQRDKIRDIMEQQQRRAIQQRADIQLATLDLHKLMRADTPNKTSIDAAVDKLARLRATLAKDRIGAMLQAQTVLTPEQKKQLQTLRSERGQGRGGWDDDEGSKGK